MLYLTLFQISVFILYTAYVVKKFGVLTSLSESWHYLEPKNSLFTLFCAAIGIPMFLQSNGHSTFFFLSGIGFLFVGITALFGEAFKKCFHYSGAAAGMFGALMALWCDSEIWWTFPVLGASALILAFWKRVENKIWWMEMVFFILISAGLLFR